MGFGELDEEVCLEPWQAVSDLAYRLASDDLPLGTVVWVRGSVCDTEGDHVAIDFGSDPSDPATWVPISQCLWSRQKKSV